MRTPRHGGTPPRSTVEPLPTTPVAIPCGSPEPYRAACSTQTWPSRCGETRSQSSRNSSWISCSMTCHVRHSSPRRSLAKTRERTMGASCGGLPRADHINKGPNLDPEQRRSTTSSGHKRGGQASSQLASTLTDSSGVVSDCSASSWIAASCQRRAVPTDVLAGFCVISAWNPQRSLDGVRKRAYGVGVDWRPPSRVSPPRTSSR